VATHHLVQRNCTGVLPPEITTVLTLFLTSEKTDQAIM
jgi:hypothetical protein